MIKGADALSGIYPPKILQSLHYLNLPSSPLSHASPPAAPEVTPPLLRQLDDDPVVGSGISSTGRYVMCCSERGRLTVLDLRGGVLASTDTRQAPVHAATISPCGRFVMSAGEAGEMGEW